MDWNPDHEYFIQGTPPLGGFYKRMDMETVRFLQKGGYIKYEFSRDFGPKCHYFTKD